MEYKTGTISCPGGQELYKHEWNIDSPIARVVIVHGYAEHGKRYHEFAAYLNNLGIDVLSYDQRGHGMTGGLKAFIARFEYLLDDLNVVLNQAKSDDLPLFLFGHSMGGLVAVLYCIERDITYLKGMIISAAALKLDDDLSPIMQKLAPILGFLFPTLPTTPLDTTYLSRNETNLKEYLNDPLIYVKGTRARTGAEMIKSIKRANKIFEKLNIPFLAMHGTADKLTDPKGTVRLLELAQSTDKEIELYDGLYHELIHEPEKDKVYKDISSWILKRVNAQNQ